MQNELYKYRLKLAKLKELRFISHLDWQSLILKIFRRCAIKLVLSEGFNKMPKVSFSPALPIFIESVCELVNFQTLEPLKENFKDVFQNNSPNGLKLIDLSIPDINEPKSLENYLQWASYIAKQKKGIYNLDEMRYIINKCLSSDEFLITKKTKKDIQKTVNYRNSIKNIEIKDDGTLSFILKVGQNEATPALRADDFIKKLFDNHTNFLIKRTDFFDINLRVI